MQKTFEELYESSTQLQNIDLDTITPELFKLACEFCFNCGEAKGINDMFNNDNVVIKEGE